MLDDPLRGGDLLEENGCITTVPEWREDIREEVVPSLFTCCVRQDERAREEDTVREGPKNMSVWDRHKPYRVSQQSLDDMYNRTL